MVEDMARQVFHQVAIAVYHIHKLKIYHRDIKMMNVFVHKGENDDYRFLLGDFGTATLLDSEDQKVSDMQGTMHWMAPEVITKSENGLKADIWSLGVLLHALVCGQPPYDGRDYSELRASHKKGELKFRHRAWAQASSELVELVCAMLEKDQAKRFSIAEVIQHPWL